MKLRVPSYTRKPILAMVAAATLLLAACGGKQSMASKSAAAYREAQAKGTPVGSEGHGEHAGAPATYATAGPHENHPQPDMTRETPAAPEHGSHGETTRSGHAAGHETAPAHATHDSKGHSSSGPPPTPHDSMQHSPVPAKSDLDVKKKGGATARTQPGGTLRPDEFDAASPLAVSEAAKAGGSGTQAKPQDEAQPMDHTSHDQRSGKTTADKPSSATVYTCPMHPEVTSASPGNCPKCGMNLVRREK